MIQVRRVSQGVATGNQINAFIPRRQRIHVTFQKIQTPTVTANTCPGPSLSPGNHLPGEIQTGHITLRKLSVQSQGNITGSTSQIKNIMHAGLWTQAD
jgi:hypothetical protein